MRNRVDYVGPRPPHLGKITHPTYAPPFRHHTVQFFYFQHIYRRNCARASLISDYMGNMRKISRAALFNVSLARAEEGLTNSSGRIR